MRWDRNILEYVKSRIVIDENECWNWQGSRYRNGYGEICHKGYRTSVHRLMYIIHYGWTEKCILHKCDNPSCCNLEHLFEGTLRENSQDMIRKGRGKSPFPNIKGEDV